MKGVPSDPAPLTVIYGPVPAPQAGEHLWYYSQRADVLKVDGRVAMVRIFPHGWDTDELDIYGGVIRTELPTQLLRRDRDTDGWWGCYY